ncbi:MAG: hypothetical protein PVJ49_04880 [Acidobacteriota bacterium]|jgi:uncharacterized protein YndB with AHSA1/START domain
MPIDKDLKRLIRARMDKTGESYTAARAQILTHSAPGNAPRAYAELAGMSDDAVRKATGRDWAGWVELLDHAAARGMAHREIATLLRDGHDVPKWWAQMVTVGYERIRGLREKGQRRDGTFEVNKSKTVPVPVERLYRAFAEKRRRSRWLPDSDATVSTSRRNQSVRFTWGDGLPVEVRFTAKSPDKTQVTVEHRGLPDRAAAEASKAYWAERLAALADLMSSAHSQ